MNKKLAKCIGLTSKDSDARIIFYVGLERKKERVPKFESIKDRKNYVQQRIHELNQVHKAENRTKQAMRFVDLIEAHLQKAEKDYSKNIIRYDTIRTYRVFGKVCKELAVNLKVNEYVSVITKMHVIKVLDYLFYKKDLRPRTRNNYLRYLSTVFLFGLDREFCTINPCAKIPKLENGAKLRKVIPTHYLKEIFDYFKENNYSYYIICMVEFYCFIRRTELTKIKVKHLKINDYTFFIPASIAKNNKDGIITVPTILMKLLKKHIEKANQDDFIFSSTLKPGKKQMKPYTISNIWYHMREKLDVPKQYQFYSLKDTGITNLFHQNIPTIKIKDQARHQDISVTEKYTPRNFKSDDLLKNINFNI